MAVALATARDENIYHGVTKTPERLFLEEVRRVQCFAKSILAEKDLREALIKLYGNIQTLEAALEILEAGSEMLPIYIAAAKIAINEAKEKYNSALGRLD